MKKLNVNTENNQTWLTPPELINSLGGFDLDPCTPINRPWDTAKNHYTKEDDGLLLPWFGRIWCNPPYGKYMGMFMEKMALHNNGIGLTFARTETRAFQNFVFPFAESILFIEGRIHFYDKNGNRSASNGGAPSVLISYGENNADAIEDSGIKGYHQYLKSNIFVIGVSNYDHKTWRIIVGEALLNLDKKARLNEIYDQVTELAPKRIQKNKNYKAKVRQVLQAYFERVEKGVYRNAS